MQWFGPPLGVTRGSSCPWLDHPVSGLPRQTVRAFHTRFRFGFAPKGLNLAGQGKSQAHYAKGMRSPRRAPTVCRRMISGSVSLPSRGSFHLSLAVLVHYRSLTVFSLGGWAPRIQTAFHVCRPTRVPSCRQKTISPTGLSPSMADRSRSFGYSSCSALSTAPQPHHASMVVWALPRSFATTCGISVDVYSSGY